MSGEYEFVIVGAGLGGLALAALLARQARKVLVLEGEASPDARTQGGTLDLHPESGQQAMSSLGLDDAVAAITVPLGEHHRIADRDGVVLVDMAPAPAAAPGRPEVDRGALRSLLLDAVGADRVRWGAKVTDVRADEHGWAVHVDGSTVTGRVLIGADGAWSRVRRVLSDVVPTPLGTVAIDLGLVDLATTPELASAVGPGAYWAVGDGTTVSAQATVDGRARVYVSTADPAGELTDDVSRTRLLERFHGWGATPRALIASTTEPPVVRRIAVLPTDFGWRPRSGVTLIGDAAHLMPPVGEGANQALLDAVVLAEALDDHVDPDHAIAAYERELAGRIHQIAEESARIHAMLSAPDAAERLVAMFGGSQLV